MGHRVTVMEEPVVAAMERHAPGFAFYVCDERGRLRRHVNIFVGDEDIRFMDGINTAVSDSDEVSIIPAIAGG